MKHNISQHIIHGLCRDISRSLKRMRKHIRVDDIHDFRVQVKQLRAFLRMASLDKNCRRRIRVPASIRQLYRKSGRLRDMQLFEENALACFVGKKKPGHFVELLERDLSACELSFKKALGSISNRISPKTIFKKFPDGFRPIAASYFFDEKTGMINRLLAGNERTVYALHCIRKNLKDLLYIKSMSTDYAGTMDEEFFSKYQQIVFTEKLAIQLGQFNDICMLIDFLDQYRFHPFVYPDFEQVEHFRQHSMHEKELMRINLYNQLNDMVM